MMESELHTALASMLTLAGLLYFVLGPYNSYRIDRLRHDLFKIRDELFIEAAVGRVSFDSGAYQYTRTMLNGMIRYAHRVSLVRLALGAAVMSLDEIASLRAEHESRFADSLTDERSTCEACIERVNQRLAYHLITSPAVAVFVVPLVIMALKRLAIWFSSAFVQCFMGRFYTLDGVFYLRGKTIASGVRVC